MQRPIFGRITHCTRQVPRPKAATGDAFEDVLYGSESEIEDSDDEDGLSQNANAPKRKGQDNGARLRVDDDEPMDLLSGAASRVSSEFGSLSIQ